MRKGLARSAMWMFLILLTSKVLGLSREMILAYKFGTSIINDAFAVAISIPEVLFSVGISGIIQTYIPFVSRIRDDERNSFFSFLFIGIAIIAISISTLFFINASSIAHLFAPGFNNSANQLLTRYVAIIVWAFPFYSIFSLMSAHIQMRERFTIIGICDYIVVNVIAISFICFANENRNSLIIFGYVVAYATACLLLAIYFLRECGNPFVFKHGSYFKEFYALMKLAIPVGICFMMNQVNGIMDKFFASMLGSGFTSSLNYANKIQAIFLTLTTTVFMTVCFPRINKCFAEDKIQTGLQYAKKGYALALFVAIPFSYLLVAFSGQIVSILFERGKFGTTSTIQTARYLQLYALGIVFYALSEVQTRLLTAYMKQRVLMRNTVIVVTFNIIMDYIFMKVVGGPGLALATSLAGIVMFILMCHDLKSFNLWIGINPLIYEALKIVIATAIAGGCARIIYHTFLRIELDSLRFIFSGCVFAVTYLLCGLILKTEILSWIIKTILSNTKLKSYITKQ